jgi:hypothetical protein
MPIHEKLIANSMDSDQNARMRRLVWNHAGRKPIMLVLSWRDSFFIKFTSNDCFRSFFKNTRYCDLIFTNLIAI